MSDLHNWHRHKDFPDLFVTLFAGSSKCLGTASAQMEAESRGTIRQPIKSSLLTQSLSHIMKRTSSGIDWASRSKSKDTFQVGLSDLGTTVVVNLCPPTEILMYGSEKPFYETTRSWVRANRPLVHHQQPTLVLCAFVKHSHSLIPSPCWPGPLRGKYGSSCGQGCFLPLGMRRSTRTTRMWSGKTAYRPKEHKQIRMGRY